MTFRHVDDREVCGKCGDPDCEWYLLSQRVRYPYSMDEAGEISRRIPNAREACNARARANNRSAL